jgi:putative ABC transport system ATP-binding protein
MNTLVMERNVYAENLAPRWTATSSTLLVAQGVTKVFGRDDLATRVLHGVSCEVRCGELVLLYGPSGSGKTTLVSILAGLMRPTTGDVMLAGHPISAMTEEQVARVRRERVGFVFQTYNLFPALTARDNVAEPLVLKGTSREVARKRADEVLGRVGLGHRLDHRPAQLSGGQKQRVAIARALAGGPNLIVGDEVTAALDTDSARSVMAMLRAHVSPERSVLVVTHDRRLEEFADRVIEMEDGRIAGVRAADRRRGGAR